MHQRFRGAVTFANVAALLALVISLSGGAYAAAKINGGDIKPKSIAGSKLKKDTVTGKQVKESSLKGLAQASALKGLVPRSDLRPVRFLQSVKGNPAAPVAVTKEILKIGSLRLRASCQVRLTSGTWYGGMVFSLSSTAPDGTYSWSSVLATSMSGPAASVQTLGGSVGAAPVDISRQINLPAGSLRRDLGTLVYSSDKARETVVVDFTLQVTAGQTTACSFSGDAVRTTS